MVGSFHFSSHLLSWVRSLSNGILSLVPNEQEGEMGVTEVSDLGLTLFHDDEFPCLGA